MSIYTPPALNAVNFALEVFTPADMTPAEMALSVYSVPALNAVNFALTAYTPPTIPYVGWELDGDASITAALAWVEADDVAALAGTISVSVALGWTEADDSHAISAALGLASALAWVESDDAWAITGEIVSTAVEADIAWTEEDDTYAVVGEIQTVTPPLVGAGGGSSWFASTREEERRLLDQIEAVLRETLSPKKAAPILNTLSGVDAVVAVRAEVERIAEEARADAQLQEVLADVQAKIAIFVARQKRMRDDEELMMVL